MSYRQSLDPGRLVTPLHYQQSGHVSDHGLRTTPSEGEGACLAKFKGRCHLPLRGKLGWMTPRIRCENDAGYETCFRGSRSQAGAPFFADAPGTLTTGHKTTVILQDCHAKRLSFRAERSVIEESASRFYPLVATAETSGLRHTCLNSTSSPPQSSPDPTRAPPASPATAKRRTQTTIPFSRRSGGTSAIHKYSQIRPTGSTARSSAVRPKHI